MPTTPNTPNTPNTLRISPRAERQRCMNELFETVAYIDPDTGVIYDPARCPGTPTLTRRATCEPCLTDGRPPRGPQSSRGSGPGGRPDR